MGENVFHPNHPAPPPWFCRQNAALADEGAALLDEARKVEALAAALRDLGARIAAAEVLDGQGYLDAPLTAAVRRAALDFDGIAHDDLDTIARILRDRAADRGVAS